mmetsp:Transcript_3937/g.7573  ORF Transcript_3937/g.7573 Transcript_3937/m.7573 type:complete len:235 (+) Transcript_3937:789-1493(+)
MLEDGPPADSHHEPCWQKPEQAIGDIPANGNGFRWHPHHLHDLVDASLLVLHERFHDSREGPDEDKHEEQPEDSLNERGKLVVHISWRRKRHLPDAQRQQAAEAASATTACFWQRCRRPVRSQCPNCSEQELRAVALPQVVCGLARGARAGAARQVFRPRKLEGPCAVVDPGKNKTLKIYESTCWKREFLIATQAARPVDPRTTHAEAFLQWVYLWQELGVDARRSLKVQRAGP